MVRKILLSSLLFLITAQFLGAQVFFKARGGYNAQAAKSIIETRTVADSTLFTTLSPIFVTLGGGGTAGLDVGYMFNEHVGMSLGFQMLISTKEEALTNQTPITDITAIAYTRQGQAVLGGLVSTGGDPWNLYADAGILVPLFGQTIVELAFVSETFNADEFTRTENSGKFSVGFYGGIGVEYRLSDLLGISLESRFTNLRIKSLGATMIERTDRANDVDLLPDTPVINVNINYVDELNSESNNPEFNSNFSSSEPLDEINYTSNYSNVSFQLGIGIYLGK